MRHQIYIFSLIPAIVQFCPIKKTDMISSRSKKKKLYSDSKAKPLVQHIFSWATGIHLELYLTLLFGGTFLAIFLFSEDVLLEELSKAMLIVCLLSLFRFLGSNSNNLK